MNTDRQLIEDLLSALEYHQEQTRPIHFTTTAIQAAREHLRKPLAEQPTIPPGHKLVPVEPTKEMLQAGRDEDGYTHEIYAAMLNAAPEAPQPKAEQQEPVACKHDWFQTGAMAPGEMRCIHCGQWGNAPQPKREPLTSKKLLEAYVQVKASDEALMRKVWKAFAYSYGPCLSSRQIQDEAIAAIKERLKGQQ